VALAAVIFDFDGVLADSEPVHLQVFQAVLQTVGIDLAADEYYAKYLGYSDRDAFRQVMRDRGRPLDDSSLDTLLAHKMTLFPAAIGDHALYDGAAACVARVAAEVPVAIASGALRHEILLMLERGGLADRFPIIVAAGETPRSKPHPDPYAEAFARLKASGRVAATVTPADVVAIEDSEWGLQSARAAGLRTIAVLSSYDKARLPSAEDWVASLVDITVARLAALVGSEQAPR